MHSEASVLTTCGAKRIRNAHGFFRSGCTRQRANIRMSSIPWQSANKDLKTPRLALPSTRYTAKESWKKGPEVRMSAYDRSQGVADSAPDTYANAGPAAFGKSYSADRAIQDARGDEGEARSHKLRAWRVLRNPCLIWDRTN